MDSARHYVEVKTDTYSGMDWGANYLTGEFKGISTFREEEEGYSDGLKVKDRGDGGAGQDFGGSLNDLKKTYEAMKSRAVDRMDSPHANFLRFKAACINYLLMLFLGLDRKDLLLYGADGETKGLNVGIQSGSISEGGEYNEYHFEYEAETASYQAKGKVVTEDGRELEFGLSVSMSREFLRETELNFKYGDPLMCDPLVIHMDSLPGQVSDQTFMFDIDSDGIEDKISKLVKGSGFLALDLNEDGIINDGSELFGTQSGDGFADLEKYDEDGNGWIDENDSIYDKLRIWTKDEEGQDALLTLKEGDVGAISLRRVPTSFFIKNDKNLALSQVRASGFFLEESTGHAGSIQQMDFAKQAG